MILWWVAGSVGFFNSLDDYLHWEVKGPFTQVKHKKNKTPLGFWAILSHSNHKIRLEVIELEGKDLALWVNICIGIKGPSCKKNLYIKWGVCFVLFVVVSRSLGLRGQWGCFWYHWKALNEPHEEEESFTRIQPICWKISNFAVFYKNRKRGQNYFILPFFHLDGLYFSLLDSTRVYFSQFSFILLYLFCNDT